MFPALLGGLVVAVVALAAGGSPSTAALLGGSMALLQLAVGALGGLVPVSPLAAGSPGTPSPGHRGQSRTAVGLGVALAAAGVLLAGLAEPLSVVVAAAVLAVGLWHELAARGTRLSWLPVALGVPLLPLFGWIGATGALPGPFVLLVPAAALAGAALAIASEAVDLERDADAGVVTLAVSLGPVRASLVVLGLQVAVAVLATMSGARVGAAEPWLTAVSATALLTVAGACLGVLAARRGASARELAFELQAIGLGLLTVAWVNAMSAAAGA